MLKDTDEQGLKIDFLYKTIKDPLPEIKSSLKKSLLDGQYLKK